MVPIETLREKLAEIANTVAIDSATLTASVLVGFFAPVPISTMKVYDCAEFCHAAKERYIEALMNIAQACVCELEELAKTGRTDQLIKITKRLDGVLHSQIVYKGEDHPTGSDEENNEESL